MNNYREQIMNILEEEFLDNFFSKYFEDDDVTNKTFRINSSMLKGKFDPLFFTGMNVVINHLVKRYPSFKERGITVLTGDPFKSKFFGVGDYKLIRIRDIKRNYIDYDNAAIIPEAQFLSFPNSHAQPNDVLIGMDGDEFRAAMIEVRMIPCAINQRVSIIRGLDSDLAVYFMLAINSYIGIYQLERVKTFAGTVGHISMDDVKNLRFPLDENYIGFVNQYKQTIEELGLTVSGIKETSDKIRENIYSRLDLKPTEKIKSFIRLW